MPPTSDRFRSRLDRLCDAVVAMGDLVATQLERAVTAIRCCDRALAREVIETDAEVNRRYLALERECLSLIARHQPVAGDLRAIVAAFTIVTDVERVGDLAVNLAEYARESVDCRVPDVDLERIAGLARSQFEAALDAFAAADADRCVSISRRDDELDERCSLVNDRIVRELLELTLEGVDSDPGSDREDVESNAGDRSTPRRPIADVSLTLLIVRDLERIGDHAVNVAARTVYALEGDESLLE